MGGVSSARPDDLDAFTRRLNRCNGHLADALQELAGRYNAFLGANEWGVFDATSVIRAFERYARGNDFTGRWVAAIAAAFRAAGGDGRLVRLPDRAIKASLRAEGLDRHRKSVTFDKAVAYGSPPTTGYTNDPINTATGNFVEIETDLLCGGLVAALTVARTYNSRSDRVGPFGRGWSSWASARLHPQEDGAQYIGPDGQEALFPRMGEGYGRVLGVEGLVEVLPTGLALERFDGTRWVFDDAGRPIGVSRGPGTAVTLSHDAEGRLAELAHGGGKTVRLSWDDAGERVAAVECSDGRRVAYGYDDAGNLVAIEGADGTRRYELDERGRVISVIDADGVVELVNTYDDDGRVLEQLSPFGRHTHLHYLPGRVTVTMDDGDETPVNTYIHDAEGRLLAIVDGDDEQLAVTYDDWGNPSSVTERNGSVTVQEWDDRGRPLRRTLPTGVTIAFTYDDRGRVVELAASDGAVTRYGYTADERIASEIVDPEGAITRRTVRDGLVHEVVDPDGVTMRFAYDADGQMVASTDADENTAQLERDAAGRVIAAVSPLGRRTAFFYDQHGRLVERHDPAGAAWRYEYTPAGRVASVTDPTGAREEIRYGEHGNPAAVVDPLGRARAREYDVFGNLVAVAEPDGSGWEYGYDALMRWTHTVDPAGATWRQEYDVNGTLIASVDPVGSRMSAAVDPFGRVVGLDDGLTSSSFELDELGQLVRARFSDGTSMRAEYDLCGRRTRLEDATGGVLRVEYTPGGRVARQVSPSGRAESLEYDVHGRVAAHIDGAGRRTEYRYDADGDLVEIELPTGELERHEYDACGRPTRFSSPGAGVTTYEHDLAGRIVAITDREAGERRYEYDAAGQLVAAVDANGATTRYAYNDRGWLTQITDPLGGTVIRHHDPVGRIVEQIDQLGRSTTFTYDAAGRLVEQVDGAGATIRHAYDIAGRIVSSGPAGEEPITIEYDAAGRAVAVEEPGAISNRLRWDAEGRLVERRRGDLAMRWNYTADGERSAIGYPDATETTFARDDGGSVVAAHHPALGRIALERDVAGRLTGASADGMQALWRYAGGDLVRYEMQAGAKHRTAELTRDALGRVAEATIDGHVHRFAYDPAGQLVSAQTPAGALAYSYDANGRLVHEDSPSGPVDYEYDAAGQLVARTNGASASRYEYDGAGRRVGEHGPGLDRSYAWDAFGRLTAIERSGPDDDAASISVVVDALGELAELDGTAMLWDTAHPYSPLTWSGQDAVLGEGAPWALAGGGAATWLAPDWQGTIGDASRDPWGAPPSMTSAIAAGPRLGYRGEVEFDGETWLRHRVYQPATRSFPQPDPMPPEPGTPSAANPYHYAANNPIGRADPLGLRPVTEHELDKIRDGMDRNLLSRGVDIALKYHPLIVVGKFVIKNATEISMVTGILALIPGPQQPILAGISIGTGLIATGKAAIDGDWKTAGIDAIAVVPGVKGLQLAFRSRGVAKGAARAEAARPGAWKGKTPAEQIAEREAIKHDLHHAHEVHKKALKYDAAAAGGATNAVVYKHWINEEKEKLEPTMHRPEPVRLRPIHR